MWALLTCLPCVGAYFAGLVRGDIRREYGMPVRAGCVRVCVRACGRVFVRARSCLCVRARSCVCVCVCVWKGTGVWVRASV